MEPVKLASGIGGHGPQILYPGGRQPPPVHPPGTQVVHPSTTRSHDGSPYKGTSSPPMVSRGAPYPSYATVVDGAHGGTAPRYLQQPTYLSYQRDSHYARSMSDRPVLLPQAPKRPSIMGGYSGYTRDVMQMLPTTTLPVSTSVDSCKRIKLSPLAKTDVRFPLVIDTETNHTSRESSYYPQVEAISPTLPPDPRDESPLHSTKDDLIKQIEQVDKEISLTDGSIQNLRKKEDQLEAAAAKGDSSSQPEVDECKEVRHQSTAQVIYAENRKIAEEGHNSLAKLIPPSEMPRVLPLYHQPSDTEVYQQNKAKYSTFKQRLLEYFKKKQEMKYNREQQITQTYTKLMNDWLKKVDKVENSKKHKEKVGKSRELFEKVFPELRKQREDKERFSRVGARVKSDAEMEEIIDGIQDQENEDKKMRAYAVIPPILLDEKRRSYRYVNKNGLVEDPMGEYKEQKNVNIWTDQETEIFKDKYLQHPKNFVVIASYLERKSVADCIQNYYLTKKKENYKLQVKRRMRRPRKGNVQPPVDTLVAINSSTGVTTRGSAAAAQKELLKNGSGGGAPLTSSGTVGGSSSTGGMIVTTSAAVLISSSSSIVEDGNPGINGTPMLATSPSINWALSSASTPTNSDPAGAPTNTAGSMGEMNSVIALGAPHPPPTENSSASPPPGSEAVIVSSASIGVTSSLVVTPNTGDSSILVNCQEVREKDKENLAAISEKLARRERSKNEDSSDDENIAEHGRGGPHDCVVCKTRLEHFGQSRPVSSGQASQYGLSESALLPNARVCSNCRCRAVKRRIPQCLIPTCTTTKWRVKRLRPFPSRWNHLPASLKDPIIKELKIPSDVTKSCSACHNRIVRKLGSDAEEPLDTSRWSEDDVENLRAALREVGCHWSKVAERIKNKTEGQCKSFYFNLKGKYKLDEAFSEYRRSKGKTDPPTVTDEEESGSSTSSCEEAGALPLLHHHPPPQVRHDSASDTASASSPPPSVNNIDAERKETGSRDSIIKEPPPPGSLSTPPALAREDNDSSATASADEGQNGAGRDSPPEVQHIPHPGERRPSSQPLVSGANKPLVSRNLPQPQPTAVNAASGSTPNFKQIIDNTIEATIAKTAKDNKGYHENKMTPVNDHITITSLLENSSYSQKIPPGRTPVVPGWGYSHPAVIDPRAVPERHGTPTPCDDYCEGGLDLTVKKRDRSPPPPPLHPQPQLLPSAVPPREIPTITMRGGAEVIVTGKNSPPRAHSNSISYTNPENSRYLQDYRKSPSNFTADSRGSLAPPTPPTMASIVSRVPSPHMIYGGQTPRQPLPLPKTTKSSMAPPPPLSGSSPRVSHSHVPPPPQNSAGGRIPLKLEKGPMAVHGSITHGTPVNQHTLASVPLSQANRYDMLPKPLMTREGGSITQGTPVHHDSKRGAAPPPPLPPPPSQSKESLMLELRSGVEIIPRPSPSTPYDRETYRAPRPTITAPSSYPYTTYAYTTRPPYSDSQISSRQIIETDYLTSQQMAGRRGAPLEKEIRISPRGRDQGPPPQSTPRDHRGYPPPPTSAVDRRSLEQLPRSLDSRSLDHRVEQQRADPSLEFRPVEGDKRKVQYVRTTHGLVPIHSQSSAASQHYLTASDVRVSRPSASPASTRDATPTPPTSDTLSPHDFRPPGVSTPTPPPRLSSVIQRQPPSKTHLVGPPKSGSPRPDVERYSPHTRHLTIIPSMTGEPLNIADMLQRPGSYSSMDVRRDGRQGVPSHHSVPSHDRLEGIGKQVVETLQNSRYVSDSQGNEREKEIHTVEIRPPVEERRFYERMDYNRVRMKEDYRNIPCGGKVIKEPDENDPNKIILNYQMEQSKASPSPKNLTAANLIEAIITNQINQGHMEEAGRDPRVFRREGEPPIPSHAHPASDSEKMVRSPATISAYHSKEKEIVTVEDGTDLTTQSRHHGHKEGLATLHPVPISHHSNYSKGSQVHMETVISREFGNSEGKKILNTSANHPYNRPPLEITRTDGRPVTHLNLYDQPKIRSSSGTPQQTQLSQSHHGEKDAPPLSKDCFDTRASHRIPPSTGTSVHIHPGSHLATDERQIIRIAQPQPQSRSDNPFDFIKNKIKEIWREDTPENPASDRRMHESQGARHSRSGTPINQQQQQPQQSQQQQPQQQPLHQSSSQSPQQHPPPRGNAHYDEEHAKKRPRLDLPEGSQRPPSRPRSTGGGGGIPGGSGEGKEEVADSPQSGEMVIDESPRDGKMGGDLGQPQDKGPSRPAVSQYPNSYPGYRGGGNPPMPPHTGSWGVNPPPPPTATTTVSSGGRPQGYEPNVEPVSDDE